MKPQMDRDWLSDFQKPGWTYRMLTILSLVFVRRFADALRISQRLRWDLSTQQRIRTTSYLCWLCWKPNTSSNFRYICHVLDAAFRHFKYKTPWNPIWTLSPPTPPILLLIFCISSLFSKWSRISKSHHSRHRQILNKDWLKSLPLGPGSLWWMQTSTSWKYQEVHLRYRNLRTNMEANRKRGCLVQPGMYLVLICW